MGRSVIHIVVTGNHGCDRTAKENELLRTPCDSPGCIDCTARKFVAEMNTRQDVESATHTHWPDDPNGGITDDLLEGRRIKNQF